METQEQSRAKSAEGRQLYPAKAPATPPAALIIFLPVCFFVVYLHIVYM